MTLILPPHAISSLLSYFPILVLIWVGGVIIYRLYFHPLSHIPGPRLAATTYFYIFYYYVIAPNSRFYLQVEKLHQKYGPVVRITPNEIHLSDPRNYNSIYYVGTKYSKSPEFYDPFGLSLSAFGANSDELHRVRRAALNPHFSRKSVLELEAVVQSKAHKFCDGVADAIQDGRQADIHHGLRAVSVDVITDYAFDNCYNLLDKPGFGLEYFEMVNTFAKAFWIFMMWPVLVAVVKGVPMWLGRRLGGPMAEYMQMLKDCRDQVLAVKATMDAANGKISPARTTIFHQLLDPNVAEGHVVPSIDGLVEEAFAIVAAASETVGNALTVGVYNVLSNEEISSKLTAELKESFPDSSQTLDFITLEKLPYLSAVIKESLRLSYGVIGRLPRVTPHPGAVLNGYSIPPGSIVSMSAWTMHRNPTTFPTPDKFDPSRWLDPEAARKLDQNLVAFSKGTRQCVGMNLAYCELYVTVATFFRRFEKRLEIYKTGPEDFVYDDYFSPLPPKGAHILHAVARTS